MRITRAKWYDVHENMRKLYEIVSFRRNTVFITKYNKENEMKQCFVVNLDQPF